MSVAISAEGIPQRSPVTGHTVSCRRTVCGGGLARSISFPYHAFPSCRLCGRVREGCRIPRLPVCVAGERNDMSRNSRTERWSIPG